MNFQEAQVVKMKSDYRAVAERTHGSMKEREKDTPREACFLEE